VKALIFDFDGTIADSFTTLDVFEEIMNRPQKLTPEEIENLRGQKIKLILKYLKIKKWQIPKLAIKARKAMSVRIADVRPFDEIPKVVRDLKLDGFDMYILSSNGPENIRKFLATNDIEDCFRNIYGNISLRGKSAGLKKVLKHEKLNKNECVYIGDELRDIEAAKKVGIKIISVSWGFFHPETLKKAAPNALILKPTELSKILQDL
jgi:phosphoglycolate phosphatase